jgi:hypothetical protein
MENGMVLACGRDIQQSSTYKMTHQYDKQRLHSGDIK